MKKIALFNGIEPAASCALVLVQSGEKLLSLDNSDNGGVGDTCWTLEDVEAVSTEYTGLGRLGRVGELSGKFA